MVVPDPQPAEGASPAHSSRRGTAIHAAILMAMAQTLCAAPSPDEWPYDPRFHEDAAERAAFCENGIWRVRTTKQGIMWFDFYHAKERCWYINRNNLNIVVRVAGQDGWMNSELERVQPTASLLKGGEEARVLYRYGFPSGAVVHLVMRMRRSDPYLRFEAGKADGSVRLSGFQWHITFGQAEAVSRLRFDGHDISADGMRVPLRGGRLELQDVRYFRDLRDLSFHFAGKETVARDPKNPAWMGRVLGLQQHAIWTGAMAPGDHFAFEARDQPWQPGWEVPEKVPWIEGLWFIREGEFRSDGLTYGISNLDAYLPHDRKVRPPDRD